MPISADDVLGYASVSTGFKSGNIQDGGRDDRPRDHHQLRSRPEVAAVRPPPDAEPRRLLCDFNGYQVNQVRNSRDANGNVIASQIITQNAKGATAYGFEAEAVANFTRTIACRFRPRCRRPSSRR